MSTFSISAPSSLASHMMRRDSLSKLQSEMNRASREVATGRSADPYGSLGGRAGRALGLHGEAARLESFLTSNAVLDSKLTASESALGTMREAAQSVLTLAVGNATSPQATAEEMQRAARAAFDRIAAVSNTSHAGRNLFSGTASDAPALTAWSEPGPGGTPPEAAVAAAIGAPPATAAEAATKSAALKTLFQTGYDGTFYGGAVGTQSSAAIDSGRVLEFGVSGEADAFRDVLRGLSMLASTDVAQIGDGAAYQAWMQEAVAALGAGAEGLLSAEIDLGEARNRLDETKLAQQDRLSLLQSDTAALEGVDPYDAATRLTELQARLEASYAVTARLARLSFLDYL
ncbi:flagellin N-terminal helical domain-containing protein [Roseivivax sp. CAU 1761]